MGRTTEENKDGHMCMKCNNVYKNRSHLSRHKTSCQILTRFDCEKCAKSFSRKDTLADHRKICKGKKRITICVECDKDFITSCRLKGHYIASPCKRK